MNTALFLISIATFALACGNSNSRKGDSDPAHSSQKLPEEQIQNRLPVLLNLKDAELILGEPAFLADSNAIRLEGGNQYTFTYTAIEQEPQTGKKGNIYYMLEHFDQVSTAQEAYSSIKIANQNHDGIETLQDLGDEGYFHSDGQNFCFILVRKENAMFRMKVNKLTGKTSLAEFNHIAERIAGAL